MRKLPYAVHYIDRDLTDDGLTHHLNMQWKDGWEYVSHLPDGLEERVARGLRGPGGGAAKQALLMKKRDVPEPFKVFNALMSLYNAKNLTMDELFASFTSLLSADPSDLPEVRAWLGDKTEVRERFEEWLLGLKDRPVIAMSNGTRVEISDELLEALEEEERESRK